MKEQSDMPSWWRCDTHGPGTRTAWGCPECVRELRTSLATATRERDEARAEVERLRKTLDEIATYWNGSHRPAETLDAAEWTRGVAEEALAATEARPVNPDGLPTYDKEKALEWVAQLRDGNKEVKP